MVYNAKTTREWDGGDLRIVVKRPISWVCLYYKPTIVEFPQGQWLLTKACIENPKSPRHTTGLPFAVLKQIPFHRFLQAARNGSDILLLRLNFQRFQFIALEKSSILRSM